MLEYLFFSIVESPKKFLRMILEVGGKIKSFVFGKPSGQPTFSDGSNTESDKIED